jgi:hypothetical protein
MTDALPPTVALAFLRELSADLRAGLVLDAAGERLAGEEALVAPARALLAAAPGEAVDVEVATGAGVVFAARDERHAVVAACGRHALPALVRRDLRTVLARLDGAPAGAPA